MVSSFLALALFMLYLNYSCNAKSLQSISAEKNGSVANPMNLFQNSDQEKSNLFCLSAGCVTADMDVISLMMNNRYNMNYLGSKSTASLINSMNESVDPCDDFYQFACGNYLENTFLNDGELQRSRFREIEKKIKNKLLMIVAEPIQLDELRPFKMLKTFFKSCMDEEQINKIGLQSIKEMLKSIGGWPVLEAEKWNESKFTWMEALQKLIVPGGFRSYINYFISITIFFDLKNNTQKVIHLNKASLGLQQAELLKGKDNTVVEEYCRYMVDIAELFGADPQSAMNDMRESLELELELAKINEQLGEIQIDEHQSMNILDLQKIFPNTPWQELFNKLPQHQDYNITFSLKYLEHLEILLNKTPKRVQANYMIWRYVMDSVSYLNDELRKKQQNYKKKLIKPRREECMDISTNYFTLAIGSLYVRRVYNENPKQKVLEMVNAIMEDLYKMLSYNEWMDDETRKQLIDKAKSITYEIAYPNELLDDNKLNAYYEHLEVNDQDFYTSALNLTILEIDQLHSSLKSLPPQIKWTESGSWAHEVNSYYILFANSFVIAAGNLQDVFFSNDRPQYMLYGAIGWIIGHEITHGFDNIGKQYDQHGNMVDWLPEEMNKLLLEKEKCFIRQYENYTVHEIGLKLNGTQTLGDNIADNGGLSLAYHAYREWAKGHDVEPLLPGLQKYTPQQIFWLNAANIWCSKESRVMKEFEISRSEHSPNRFRVIGTFSNMKEFSADFQCPLGSNMNPVKKCQVW